MLFKHSHLIKRSQSGDQIDNIFDTNYNSHSLLFSNEKAFNIEASRKQPVILMSFYESADKYRKFLRILIQAFSELKNDNIMYAESLCGDLLKWCHTSQDTQQVNIHYSLFFERILRDPIIKVKYSELKYRELSEWQSNMRMKQA
jgi:hypothetical protein